MRPAATDLIRRVQEGVVAILDVDPAVTTITRRHSCNCMPWQGVSDVDLPVLLLQFVDATEWGAIADHRRIRFRVTAMASGNDSEAICDALVSAAETLLVQPRFAALGLDAYPERRNRYRGPLDPVPAGSQLARSDLELTLIAHQGTA